MARDKSLSLAAHVVASLLGRAGDPPVRVALWTGETVGSRAEAAVATVRLARPSVLWKLLANPDLQFGRCYVRGDLAVEGPLADLLTAAYDNASRHTSWRLRLVEALGLYDRAIGAARARSNARHHYEVGEDFYRLWLDPTLTYSCAYFPREDSTLEEAQLAKLDLVCRKLRLKPGEHVVEAGSGWGSLALYMAEKYGARVTAYNTASAQVAYARRSAADRGLSDRVTFVEGDYREIRGCYDAFVAVGMLEHVGRKQYRLLGNVIARSLRPDGRGLLHTIGRGRPRPMNPWIREAIFPGGHAPAVSEIMAVLEPNDLTVCDIENLRPHYARTLECWIERLEAAGAQIEQRYGPEFLRTWQLYLAGAIASFRTGWLDLYQVVFAPSRGRIPQTRRPPQD